MGYIVIAPAGDNLKALYIGMKEFPTERVILITPSEYYDRAKKEKEKLEEFTIKTEIREIKENILEEMFKNFAEICSIYDEEDIIVNVATGDRVSTCAALSAAFANGLKAIGIMGNSPVMLPIMKLSYYNELSDNKLEILKALDGKDFEPLNVVAKKLGMSISLLSYHVNGNYKYKGLKEFRLVDVKEHKKNLCIKLSSMGKMLLKGYIQKPKRK